MCAGVCEFLLMGLHFTLIDVVLQVLQMTKDYEAIAIEMLKSQSLSDKYFYNTIYSFFCRIPYVHN